MKKFVLFLAVALMMGGLANGQTATLKLGYINSQELLSMLPEMRKADSSVQAYAKSYQDQLETMNKSYTALLEKYQQEVKTGTMTEAVKEVKEKELMDLQARMQSTQESGQDKIAKKKEELFKPILEKADKAIKEVAKEKNYDYVFDSSAGSVLYAKDGDNILAFVKAKLGVK